MSNDAQWVAEIARAEAQRAISERTIPEFPAYFMNTHWLVTYDWLVFERNHLSARIDELEQRLARLERPWWRRWLH